jgi:hypothetical protein
MPAAVYAHAAWMLVAVAIGTWSGYLGLLWALQGPGGRAPLPGRFNLRVHQWTGIVYYIMLYLGVVGGFLMVEFILGTEVSGFWEWHEWLGLLVVAIYTAAGWIGLGLLKRPAGPSRARPIAHMVLNFTGCTLIGLQILLALLKVKGVF